LQHPENQAGLPKTNPLATWNRSAADRWHGRQFIHALFLHPPLSRKSPQISASGLWHGLCKGLCQMPEHRVEDEAQDDE